MILQRKKTSLINPYYDTPGTSLLTFHFPSEETFSRKVKNVALGKDLYVIDDLLDDLEGLRQFSRGATFSRQSVGSLEALEKGERPALTMNNKERWNFFHRPPQAIASLYRWLASISHDLDVEISTLPWELCDFKSGAPAVIANFVEHVSSHSRDSGVHKDSDPEKGIAFAIPKLYEIGEHFPSQFKNGATGFPWFVTAMVYATSENFSEEDGMGTLFFDEGKEIGCPCKHGRTVLFASDIPHTIDHSRNEKEHWRVSYVFKLIFNPRKKELDLPSSLRRWL